MRILVFLATVMGTLILAGCATLSQAECEAGDWRALGMRDGANGRTASFISEHMSACAEYGIAVDRQAYEAGRSEGLRSFCRLDRAVALGREGVSYRDVCTGEIGISFRIVHDAARDVHRSSNTLDTVRSQLNTAVTQIANPAATEEDRARLRLDILRLQGEVARLESALRRTENQLGTVLARERLRLQGIGIVA